MGSFGVTKAVDKASPKLYEYCCSGKALPNITIEMMRASGDKRVKYLEIKMEQAIVSQVQNGREGKDAFPTETVSFSFGKIKWTYTQQDRTDGSSKGNVTGGWDTTAHKTYS
jgi:type VI secretion system secreted protein Hcp